MNRIFLVVFISIGFLNGCSNAIENYLYDIDTAKLIREIEGDAKQGDADAQYNLANRYAFGTDVPKDYVKSIYWHTKAAEQGNAIVQYQLAIAYDLGKIVTKDESKAVYWYAKSAIQNNAGAQYQLGGKYFFGKGVPKDMVLAYAWFNIAEINGDAGAAEILVDGELLLNPNELRQAKQIAAHWKVGQNIKHQVK